MSSALTPPDARRPAGPNHAPEHGTHHAPELFTERTPRIVQAAKLHRTATRRKTGRILVEGDNAVMSLLQHAAPRVIDVFASPDAATRLAFDPSRSRFGTLTRDGIEVDLPTPLHLIDDAAVAKLSGTVTSTGIFAVATSGIADLSTWLADAGSVAATQPSPMLVVCVDMAEPGNAGTIVRVADACGATGVACVGQGVDPESAKALRASAGSAFHLPLLKHASVPEAIEMLREAGFLIAATEMDGSVRLDDPAAAETLRQPIAWLMGNEAHGLGEWKEFADIHVRIPMYGKAESLNVATAAAMCLYESAKARAWA